MSDAIKKVIRNAGPVLLGGFVLWQVVFLAGCFFTRVEESWRERAEARSEFLNRLFPRFLRGEDRFNKTLATVDEKGLRRYEHLTSQPEHWKLFAPTVTNVFAFPVLEVRWDDDHLKSGQFQTRPLEPLLLQGFNQPEDVNSFLRYRNFRLRRYEMLLAPLPTCRDDEFDPLTEAWRERIKDSVRKNGDNMALFLRWQWRNYHRLHPELPEPTQVVLKIHGYGIPEPPGSKPWRYVDYDLHPVARWLPWQHNPSDDMPVLERFNPLTDGYESLQ